MKIEFTPFEREFNQKTLDELSKIGNVFLLKTVEDSLVYDGITSFGFKKFKKVPKESIELLMINAKVSLLGHCFAFERFHIKVIGYCLLEFDEKDTLNLKL